MLGKFPGEDVNAFLDHLTHKTHSQTQPAKSIYSINFSLLTFHL